MPSILNVPREKLIFHWKNLKLFLLSTNCVALVIYTFLRLFLHPVRFSHDIETVVFLQILMVCSVMAISLYILFPIAELISHLWINRSWIRFKLAGLIRLLLTTALVITVSSSQSQTVKSVTKDLNSGLTTIYENIKPGESEVVMNGEVIGHADIPLGEKFMIVNKGVKGFVTKDGKVSIGCSLTITDKKDNVLLQNADLFKTDGVVDAVKTNYLKCIVSTGKPMEWDEMYKVHVIFWDKWGKGKIVNDLSIRMIDIP